MANGLTRQQKIDAIRELEAKGQPDQEPVSMTRDQKIQAILEAEKEPFFSITPEAVTAGAIGAAEGVLPFVSSEIAAQLGGLTQAAITPFLESDVERQLKERGITESFPVSNEPGRKEFAQQAREQLAQVKENYPKTYLGTQLATGLATPLPKAFTSIPKLAKGLEATQLASTATKAQKAAELAKAMGRGVITGAKTGAALGGLNVASQALESTTGDKPFQTPTEMLETVGLSGAVGGILGGAAPPVIELGAKGIGLAARGATAVGDTVAKYTIPVLLGPRSPKAIKRFIEVGRQKKLSGQLNDRGADSLTMSSTDVKDQMDSYILKIHEDIQKGESDIDDFNRAAQEARDRLKTARKNASDKDKELLKIQDDRIEEHIQFQKNIFNKKLGDDYAKKVSAAASNLRDLLTQESEVSYQLLEQAQKEGLKIDLSDVPAVIQKELNSPSLKLGKTQLQNEQAKKARQILTVLLDNFKNYYRKGIRPTTVKDFLKNEIDRLIDQTSNRLNSAEFSDTASNALLAVRRHIDFHTCGACA